MKIIIVPATAKPHASFLARPCAHPSKSSELSDLLLRLLPTATHSCILQQFVLSLSPRLCPRTPLISPRQTRHTTSILTPLLLLSSLRMHIGLDVWTKKMKILPPISSNMSFTQIYSNQGLFFSIL
jgi:hypothetical protein